MMNLFYDPGLLKSFIEEYSHDKNNPIGYLLTRLSDFGFHGIVENAYRYTNMDDDPVDDRFICVTVRVPVPVIWYNDVPFKINLKDHKGFLKMLAYELTRAFPAAVVPVVVRHQPTGSVFIVPENKTTMRLMMAETAINPKYCYTKWTNTHD